MFSHFLQRFRVSSQEYYPGNRFCFLYHSLIVAPGQNQKHNCSSIQCVQYPDNAGGVSSFQPRIVPYQVNNDDEKEKMISVSEYTKLLSNNSEHFLAMLLLVNNISQRSQYFAKGVQVNTQPLVQPVNSLSSGGGAKRSGRKEEVTQNPNPFSPRPLHSQLNCTLQPKPVHWLTLVTLIYEAEEINVEKRKHHNKGLTYIHTRT